MDGGVTMGTDVVVDVVRHVSVDADIIAPGDIDA